MEERERARKRERKGRKRERETRRKKEGPRIFRTKNVYFIKSVCYFSLKICIFLFIWHSNRLVKKKGGVTSGIEQNRSGSLPRTSANSTSVVTAVEKRMIEERERKRERDKKGGTGKSDKEEERVTTALILPLKKCIFHKIGVLFFP